MGYYSIYRIIKDIFFTIFRNRKAKIIFIILLFAFIVFIKNNCFAMSTTSYLGEKVTFPDIPESVFNDDYQVIVLKLNDSSKSLLMIATKPYIREDYNLNCPYARLIYDNVYSITTGYTYTYGVTYDGTSWALSNPNLYPPTQAYEFLDIYYTTIDIYTRYDTPQKIFCSSYLPKFENPEIVNSIDDLQSGQFDNIEIDFGSVGTSENIYLHIAEVTRPIEEDESIIYYKNEKVVLLNSSSPYLVSNNGLDIMYSYPKANYGYNLVNHKEYCFILSSSSSSIDNLSSDEIYDNVTFTLTGLTAEQIEQNQQKVEEAMQNEQLDALNSQTDAIQNQTEQNQQFYNNILSDDYNEEQIEDSFSNSTDSVDGVSDSEYIGLFSAIFGKFSNIINGNYSTVERIEYPVMNTNEKIVVTSDILSSKIQGTFIYTFLQIFWYFLFGMYIFKFSNNLIIKIKSGKILNGYENNNEVITSTML